MKNLIIPILLIATACSGGAKNESGETASSTDDQTERIAADYPRHDFTKDKSFVSEWKALGKKYRSVPYVVKTEIGNLYLFSDKKDYMLPGRYEEKKEPFANIGLIDHTGSVLLECKYEKIGNPGAIASEYMEIQQHGKYGLFNYKTKQLISADFDVLFPSAIMGYVAIGQKGNDFFKLYEDGKMIQVSNESEIPSYRKLGERGNFDIHDKTIAPWFDTDFAIEDEYFDGGPGMIFTPSYIAKMKVIPEFISSIAIDEGGVERLVSKTEIIKPRSKSVDSFLEYFHEVGSNGRGYETEKRHLVTIDKKNKVIDSREISDHDPSNFNCEGGQYRSVKFLNDSLIEVKSNFYDYSDHSLYFAMTSYSYFEISESGKIIPLNPDSYFEMASIVKLTDAYLKGCFAKNKIMPDEVPEDYDYSNNLIVTAQLSLYDLQYMRNEIYARHGFVFKDSKWQSAFAQTEWYKGISSNVDNKITPLEKENLKFIVDWENKLKNDEEKYTKPRVETYYAAG